MVSLALAEATLVGQVELVLSFPVDMVVGISDGAIGLH